MGSISKVAFFELEEWEKEYIRGALPDVELKLYSEKLSMDNVDDAGDCDCIAVFIYSAVNKDILERLPNLKIITTMSTGFDHIDLDECAHRGISVCNVPSYGENTVAEHTFALILGLSRKLIESAERTRKGDFTLEGLRGFDLKGKKIGVVGCGAIGRHVIRIANGFEMDVIAFDVYPNEDIARDLGFSYVSFDELLSASDIITLHVPHNPHTHHMINKENIGKVKKGAILINTSRGGLVETEALVMALKDGTLGAAGLDVLEGETVIREEKELLYPEFKCADLRTVVANHLLLMKDNVIVTPHNAFNSQEALHRIMNITVENINACRDGECINTVTK